MAFGGSRDTVLDLVTVCFKYVGMLYVCMPTRSVGWYLPVLGEEDRLVPGSAGSLFTSDGVSICSGSCTLNSSFTVSNAPVSRRQPVKKKRLFQATPVSPQLQNSWRGGVIANHSTDCHPGQILANKGVICPDFTTKSIHRNKACHPSLFPRGLLDILR